MYMWNRNIKINFVLKSACSRHGGNFFSGYNQKMRKRVFFQMIEIGIEKQVTEVQKPEKITFEFSVQVKKIKKKTFFFSKNCVLGHGRYFFRKQPKYSQKVSSSFRSKSE